MTTIDLIIVFVYVAGSVVAPGVSVAIPVRVPVPVEVIHVHLRARLGEPVRMPDPRLAGLELGGLFPPTLGLQQVHPAVAVELDGQVQPVAHERDVPDDRLARHLQRLLELAIASRAEAGRHRPRNRG